MHANDALYRAAVLQYKQEIHPSMALYDGTLETVASAAESLGLGLSPAQTLQAAEEVNDRLFGLYHSKVYPAIEEAIAEIA